MVSIMHTVTVDGTESMLRITTEKKRGKTVLSVEGRLAGPLVGTLEHCWREVHGASPRERLFVDLCGVSFIDSAGKVLLKEIHRQGGELIAEGCMNQAIVREVVSKEKEEKASGRKDRGKGSHIVFYVALFSLLMNASHARAQGTPDAQSAP